MMASPIIAILAILISVTLAVPYSKYGRSCRDIGCLSDEECVMAEDPCSFSQRDSCGRYPTCKKRSSNGGESCTTKICHSGQYCRTENGVPTCVNTNPGSGYDSAGVSSVNGQSTRTNHQQPHVPADPYVNNPYVNASAPSAENNYDYNQTSYVNNNYGYPPYPTHNNGQMPQTIRPNNGANNGYPPYPSSTRQPDNRNRNIYPQHNLPQHSPGQGSTKPNLKIMNGSFFNHLSISVFIGSLIVSILSIRILQA